MKINRRYLESFGLGFAAGSALALYHNPHLINSFIGVAAAVTAAPTIPEPPNTLKPVVIPPVTPGWKRITIPLGVRDITDIVDTKEQFGDNVEIVGINRTQSILRATENFADPTNGAMLSVTSNVKLMNLTLDGGYSVKHVVASGAPINFSMYSVDILRGKDINCWLGYGVKTYDIRNCLYTNAGKIGDMQALSCTQGGVFYGNYLDRTVSLEEGSAITNGMGKNVIISGNTVVKPTNQHGAGISLEPDDNAGYDNVEISNNHITNGNIVLGGIYSAEVPTAYTAPYNNIRILNNTIVNGEVAIFGPNAVHGPIGLGMNQFKNMKISGNKCTNPPEKTCTFTSGMVNLK